mmetsp:Transcript_24087/g.75825  ORF Transcript_24087/g.75825 Transcript_24087/m.75825 type:complete len:126 (-) Transcript_24087:248-625(-)
MPVKNTLELSRRVENTGSTARDHLANERTFLAWLRTAIAILAFGLAFARFSADLEGLIAGAAFVVLGGCLLVYAGYRYFEVEHALERGDFKINTGIWVILTIFGMLTLVCVAVVITIGVHRESDQ